MNNFRGMCVQVYADYAISSVTSALSISVNKENLTWVLKVIFNYIYFLDIFPFHECEKVGEADHQLMYGISSIGNWPFQAHRHGRAQQALRRHELWHFPAVEQAGRQGFHTIRRADRSTREGGLRGERITSPSRYTIVHDVCGNII